jgi:hypothetical protein
MTTSELISISTSLDKYARGLKESLNLLKVDSFQQVFSYDLDCGILPDFVTGFQSCEKTRRFIDSIEGENGSANRDSPAVYWFEVTSNHSAKEIYKSVVDLKKTTDRNLPAHKKMFRAWDSTIVYVGKVKSNLAGRMLLHLGYNGKPSVQGLQLCHWVSKEGLKLRLNVIYLPENLAVLAGIFELELAKDLNPILGKHR